MTANDLKLMELRETQKQNAHKRRIERSELQLKEEQQPFTLAKMQTEAQKNVAATDDIYSDPGAYATRDLRLADSLREGIVPSVIWGINAAAETISKVGKIFK